MISKNNLTMMMGIFLLVILFQNCGEDSFRARLPSSVERLVSLSDNSRTATSSAGKIYYVSTSGSNSNPGTSTKPFKTIAYAVSRMVAGDTTYVKSGTYSDHIRFGRTGTATAPIKLLNAPGELPIIDCNRVGSNMVLIQNAANITSPMGYITIEGFEIRECLNGIKMYNAHNVVIRRNKIHNNTSQGILGNGKYILVDRNIINHNGKFSNCGNCNLEHGIYATGSNWTITNNLIYDNLSYGIQVAGYKHCPYGGCGDNGKDYYTDASYAGASGWLIANNTIAYNNYRSGIVLWMPLTTKTKIINNIIYENSQKSAGPQGINFSSSGEGHEIKNNVCYGASPGGTACIGSGTGKYTSSGNITTNPNFFSAGAIFSGLPNFKLKTGSPAINRGLTISNVKVDFLNIGRPRGGAHDIGAYEY